VSIANRKVQITGGEREIDYRVCGVKNGIFLYTADTDHLTKSKRQVIILTSKVRPADRYLAVKVHPEILRVATVSGPAWIDPDDSGEIVLTVSPRKDLDLGSLEYIVKILVEGAN
jgi:hypothetical protein